MLCLFKRETSDPPRVDEPASLHWNELWTQDPQASLTFYETVLRYTHRYLHLLRPRRAKRRTCASSPSWTESSSLGGGGTLALDECAMHGVRVTGDLAGYLESEPGFVTATALRGLTPLTVGGGYSASLNVQRLDLSANLPEPTDFLTYWRIEATTEGGEPLCAWSGSDSCDDEMLF